jgi:nicotinate dehydrogenase subunit B
MTTWINDDIEVERYELFENRAAWETTRRDFFRVVGGGLAIALLWRDPAFAQQPGRGGRGGGGQRPQEIGAWLHIAEDGAVTAYTGKVEIGQNIRTSLSQVVAEELRLPVNRIQMVMADTARVPFDGGTAGSQTTPQMASQLRRVAAFAREKLIDLAAEKAKVEREKFTVTDGKVIGPNQSFTFGQLTLGKKMMQVVDANTSATPAKKWTVAGTPVPKVDGRAFVTGSHEYASDVRRPGMLYGKVLRPPAFKANLKSVNTKDAEALPDVKVIHEGDFVGVVAPTVQAATEALAAIKAEWQTVPQVAAADLFKHLKESRGQGGGRGGGGFGGGGTTKKGSIPEAIRAAAFTVKATYTIAYIAHVPLEPRVGVAEFEDGKLTVWTGTQRPFGVRGEVAAAVGMPAESVRVIVPDMGAGYGGKHTGEAAVEAARLAKAAGKPVQVAWTREEEFTWAYFRPAGVIDVSAAVSKDGTLTAWEFHNYNSGGSSIRTPYEAANQQIEFHAADSPLRQGSYRALASTANTFARESVMDDLAVAAGLDPLEFRLKNLKEPRLRAVLEAAAAKFGWRVAGENPPVNGHGVGLACGTDKGSVVATCCEVSVDAKKGDVRVLRAVTAFECGAILNPDHLKNQVEGAVTMGIGGALFEHIDFADGKVLNPSFADYRLPRFKDAPVQEVVLLDRKDEPSTGAGETPIIAIAPAIGNAIRAATGVRLRSLPLVPDGFKAP